MDRLAAKAGPATPSGAERFDRCVTAAKCTNCGEVTTHAYLRGDDRRDSLEEKIVEAANWARSPEGERFKFGKVRRSQGELYREFETDESFCSLGDSWLTSKVSGHHFLLDDEAEATITLSGWRFDADVPLGEARAFANRLLRQVELAEAMQQELGCMGSGEWMRLREGDPVDDV